MSHLKAIAIIATAGSLVGSLSLPRFCLAENSVAEASPRTVKKIPVSLPNSVAPDHPLLPVIRIAEAGHDHIRRHIQDYSCIVVRQERVDGRLGNHEFIYAKVRNRRMKNGKIVVPFSVYLKFLKPQSVKDREVLYVEGQNEGEMFARRGGRRFGFLTAKIKPDSSMAMRGNRYPITEFGIENLVARLLIAAREDLDTDCQVKVVDGAKINGRICRNIIVRHNEKPANPRFHEVRIFIDDELKVPVHYEAYDWPEDKGDKPQLLERYTYLKLDMNKGFSDRDFDPDNPSYRVK